MISVLIVSLHLHLLFDKDDSQCYQSCCYNLIFGQSILKTTIVILTLDNMFVNGGKSVTSVLLLSLLFRLLFYKGDIIHILIIKSLGYV